MEKKDIVWLDYARFIGIFLVIYCHTQQRSLGFSHNIFLNDIGDYICLFHMPLFFVISGLLFKRETLTTTAIMNGGGKIISRIVIPYLIYQFFFLIYYIASNALTSYPTINENILLKYICGIIMGDGYNTPYSMTVCLPCWFLICIIQLRLLYLFIPINKFTTISMSAVSILTLVLLRWLNIDLYFCFDTTLMAIPYFLIGYYMKRLLHKSIKISNLIVVSVLLCFVVGLILKINGAAQMNGPSFGKDIILNYIGGISGTLMIFSISMLLAKCFNNKPFVKTISRNTLFIIFFHWLLLEFISRIYDKTNKLYEIPHVTNIDIVICSLIITIIILFISLYAINIGVKRVPVIFGKQKYIK